MKIIMLWAQRKCSYPGQYAPELLTSATEYQVADYPDLIQTEYKSYSKLDDFTSVRIVEAEISDEKLVQILGRNQVELKNVEGV